MPCPSEHKVMSDCFRLWWCWRYVIYLYCFFTLKRAKPEVWCVTQLPWKPAVQCGGSADKVQVVGLVDGQSFVDVTVRIDVRSHGAVQRQTAGRERQQRHNLMQKKNPALASKIPQCRGKNQTMHFTEIFIQTCLARRLDSLGIKIILNGVLVFNPGHFVDIMMVKFNFRTKHFSNSWVNLLDPVMSSLKYTEVLYGFICVKGFLCHLDKRISRHRSLTEITLHNGARTCPLRLRQRKNRTVPLAFKT